MKFRMISFYQWETKRREEVGTFQRQSNMFLLSWSGFYFLGCFFLLSHVELNSFSGVMNYELEESWKVQIIKLKGAFTLFIQFERKLSDIVNKNQILVMSPTTMLKQTYLVLNCWFYLYWALSRFTYKVVETYELVSLIVFSE